MAGVIFRLCIKKHLKIERVSDHLLFIKTLRKSLANYLFEQRKFSKRKRNTQFF